MSEITSLELLLERRNEAAKSARDQNIMSWLSAIAHYAFGILGIAGGATAAATTAADGVASWIPIVAGALAAVGSGAPTFFHFEKHSNGHANAAVNLKAVANFADNEYARVRPMGSASDQASLALSEVQKRLDAARERTVPDSSGRNAGRR